MNGKKIRQYTLVELLLTTGIICILVALLVVAYNNVYAHWSTSNTVGAMKQIELAFENFRQQNGYVPATSSMAAVEFDEEVQDVKTLAADLLQIGKFAKKDGTVVTVYDDYGHTPPSPIYYIYPYRVGTAETGTFALFSKGKDGQWGGLDDVIFLPNGVPGGLKPGFYQGSVSASGSFTPATLETLAK